MRVLIMLTMLASGWAAAVAGAVEGPAPTVASPVAAEVDLRAPASARVVVLGADHGGEDTLTYTWTSDGPGRVTFAPNAEHAAHRSVATFARSGRHLLICTITNSLHKTVTSTVAITVHPMLASITVLPANRSISAGAVQQFTAQAKDQFGQTITPAPAATWMVSDGGTITANGQFTAGPVAGGPFWVSATINTISGYSTFSINTPPQVRAVTALANPVIGSSVELVGEADVQRGAGALSWSWSAVGAVPAPVVFSANNAEHAAKTLATFSRAGTYPLRCTVRTPTGLTGSGEVVVQVAQTARSIVVLPAAATVGTGGSQEFRAEVLDQFGHVLRSPPAISWVAGGGRIGADGVYTAGSSPGGPWAVTASAGTLTGTGEVVVNRGPSIATGAAEAVRVVSGTNGGTSAVLRIRGRDDSAAPWRRYTWSVASPTDAKVQFSPNGDRAAQTTIATFDRAGTYVLRAAVGDPADQTVIGEVVVEAAPVLATLTLSPAAAVISLGASQHFTVQAVDQFGQLIPVRPELSWSATHGAVSPRGTFIADIAGQAELTVRSGAVASSARITVHAAPKPPMPKPGP